jgi:hypothetical protein
LSKGLVQEHPNPKTSKSRYTALSELVLDARIRREIPWEVIVDRTRELEGVPTWKSVDQVVQNALSWFNLDPMKEQDRYVEVWVEKDAVSSQIREVTDRYFVKLLPTRGFNSGTLLHDASVRFNKVGKPITLLYISDLDPEGEYFPTLFREQMPSRYGCFAEIEVRKIALTRHLVDDLRLTRIPLRLAAEQLRKGYVRNYVSIQGRSKVELDALDNNTLRSLIERELQSLLNIETIEEAQRKSGREVQKWKRDHGLDT